MVVEAVDVEAVALEGVLVEGGVVEATIAGEVGAAVAVRELAAQERVVVQAQRWTGLACFPVRRLCWPSFPFQNQQLQWELLHVYKA